MAAAATSPAIAGRREHTEAEVADVVRQQLELLEAVIDPSTKVALRLLLRVGVVGGDLGCGQRRRGVVHGQVPITGTRPKILGQRRGELTGFGDCPPAIGGGIEPELLRQRPANLDQDITVLQEFGGTLQHLAPILSAHLRMLPGDDHRRNLSPTQSSSISAATDATENGT